MFLPGPEATQLATYIGWLLHGTLGGIAAGAFFVLPSIFILLGLSWIYAAHGEVRWVAAIFFGLQPAVMAIVASAVLRIGKRALKNGWMYSIAALAFVALFFFHAAFPLIIASAGLIGWFGGRLAPDKFVVIQGHGASSADARARDRGPRPTLGRAFKVIAICGALWWAPVALAGLVQGRDGVLVQQGTFFSKAAMVTFGGAYSVLPYVTQSAVEHYHWLAPDEMLSGLGLAETTPGPLIMVVQFVGFMGGWRNPGTLAPWCAGTLSALLTTWVTFVPCFLWIFLGAPYIERLRDNARLSAALSTITAAVVGVVLNLAVWFAQHTLWPEHGGFNTFALVVAIVAFVGLERFKWNVVYVVLGSGAVGLLVRYVLG
jgi:chromate transporter